MDLICDWNYRMESTVTSLLQTSGDKQMEQPSTSRRRSPTLQSSALGATTISLFCLLFTLSRLDDIQVFMLYRQLIRDCRGS